MSSLNMISYNVHVLNSPIKCANIMGELKHLKAEVVLLQEIFFWVRATKFFQKNFQFGTTVTLLLVEQKESL